MTRLSNVPMWKQLFSTSRVVDNFVFNHEECDFISNYCAQLNISQAGLFASNPDYSTREARTGWIEMPTPDTQWIYDKINLAVERHNDYTFNLELSGLPYLQYAEYPEGGFHDFHMDLAFDVPRIYDYRINEHFRKLTVVLLLNQPEVDFKGGEFHINMSMERTPVHVGLNKGSLLMFPSFLLHKVCPVTWGLRKTLTTWVLGPKLR